MRLFSAASEKSISFRFLILRVNFELTFDSACSEILRSFFKMFWVEGLSEAPALNELLVEAWSVAFEAEAQHAEKSARTVGRSLRSLVFRGYGVFSSK